MTTSARTVETNAADALAVFFANIGATDDAEYWVKRLEGSFPSPIVRAFLDVFAFLPGVRIEFEDGSVLCLTVTQIKEPNQYPPPPTPAELADERTERYRRIVPPTGRP